MKEKVMELKFTITGDFVTETARRWLWKENRPWDKIKEFLFSCMRGTDKSDAELETLATAVVMGRAKFAGDNQTGDYRLEDDNSDLGVRNIERLRSKIAEQEKDYAELASKYDTLFTYLADNGYGYILKEVQRENEPEPESELLSPLLQSFLTQAKIDQEFDDNYGWLDPQGVFYPVDWGEHHLFAIDVAERNNWLPECREKYNGDIFKSGDFLTKEKGWILLHNPSHGVAFVTRCEAKRITKAQREFLYAYYSDRGLRNEAEKYLED